MFPCGETGFVLEYAEKRCQNFRQFTSSHITRWTHESELCLQRKLHQLVRSYHSESLTPDPPTCLRLEREAIDAMNKCYSIHDKLCNVILPDRNSEVPQTTKDELHSVMEAVRVGGEYYEYAVNSGVPAKVHECGHGELANELRTQPLRQRVVLCAVAGEINPPEHNRKVLVEDFLIRKVCVDNDEGLGVPRKECVYGGIDTVGLCRRNPPDQYPSERQPHFITWFANVSHERLVSSDLMEYNGVTSPEGPAGYYELSFADEEEMVETRDNSLCGDGVRQAGEECDFAGVASGCSLTCTVDRDVAYDCSTGRLESSVCWEESCMNGLKTSNEQCDDGNDQDGDGCSRTCRIEHGYSCTRDYNQTSVCFLTPTPPPPSPSPSTTTTSNLSQRRPASVTTIQPPSSLGLSGSVSELTRTSTLTVLLSTLVVSCVLHILLER